MRYLSLLFVLCATAGAFSSDAVIQPDMPPSEVPGEIAKLLGPLEKAAREDYEEVITKQLGEPLVENKSFLRWKVGNGTILMTRGGKSAPIYYTGKYCPYYMLATHNTALDALSSGAFYLSNGPTRGHPRVYMGFFNIIAQDMTYSYRRGKTDKPATFFEENPKGAVAITYSKGVSADSTLEGLPNGMTFAEITFTSQDQKNSISVKVRLSKQHALYLIDDPALNFDSGSNKGWPHNFPPGVEK